MEGGGYFRLFLRPSPLRVIDYVCIWMRLELGVDPLLDKKGILTPL